MSSRQARTGSARRLSSADRERHIVDAAIRFFAEVGFSGQTRELAQRIGVTQPLLYRYFPTKQHLIERVYKEVFLDRWNPWWETVLADRSLPLRERLVAYYKSYTETVFTYEWIRVYFFAGLKGGEINKRYVKLVEDKLLKLICAELRHEFGLPPPAQVPLGGPELELVWTMQAGIFYYSVRKYVYQVPVEKDLAAMIERTVETILDGAAPVLRRVVGEAPKPVRRPALVRAGERD